MWQRAPQWHRVIGEPLLATTKPLCADLHDLSRTIRVVLKTQVPDDHTAVRKAPLYHTLPTRPSQKVWHRLTQKSRNFCMVCAGDMWCGRSHYEDYSSWSCGLAMVSAVALPMPDAPPVTKATLLSSCPGMVWAPSRMACIRVVSGRMRRSYHR